VLEAKRSAPSYWERRRPRRLFRDGYRHRRLVKFVGIALLNDQRSGGAGPDAGTQTVAKALADQPGLAVNDFQRPFMAPGNAVAAAVAQVLVDAYDLSERHFRSPCGHARRRF
jgi:hypothetical protein